MKHLLDYLFESNILENKKSDKILQVLNKHTGSLKDFVTYLNKILKFADKQDNASLWLGAIKDLFDGEHGEEYKAQNDVAIKISELYPTQNEIDIENSAKWATKDWGAKGIGDMFKNEAFGKSFPVPVLVYKSDGKNWIIDGHHRWSQVGLLNPEGSLNCLVVSGPESVQDFLKITQGAIAAVLANIKNKNNGKSGDRQLPQGKTRQENNIFGNHLKGDKLTEKIKELFEENKNCEKIAVEQLKKAGVEVESGEDIAKLATKNRDKMIENKQNPPKWAEARPVMPQTDAAGPDNPEDSKNANPEIEGSALYAILNNHKFPNIGKE